MNAERHAYYPWYTIAEDNSLQQGDFFFDFPVFEVDYGAIAPGASPSVDVALHDVIVLSQSCDLKYEKLESVLVCPHFALDVAIETNSFLKATQKKKELRAGLIPALHALNACEVDGFDLSIRVVTFQQVFSLPFGYVKKHAEQNTRRLRLLPPYREQLAQAFARFIMRVGLPNDIPDFW
ncbi:MAG: hypothetical protein ACRDJH_09965 [Thermomicrobiales bacterium]